MPEIFEKNQKINIIQYGDKPIDTDNISKHLMNFVTKLLRKAA